MRWSFSRRQKRLKLRKTENVRDTGEVGGITEEHEAEREAIKELEEMEEVKKVDELELFEERKETEVWED